MIEAFQNAKVCYNTKRFCLHILKEDTEFAVGMSGNLQVEKAGHIFSSKPMQFDHLFIPTLFFDWFHVVSTFYDEVERKKLPLYENENFERKLGNYLWSLEEKLSEVEAQ